MAEEQKPVEVPKEEPVADPTVAAVAAPVEEPPKEETTAPATEAAATTADEPAAATEAAPAEEAKKEEPTPVEDGHLEHKGSNFPKNFIYSKKYFWFGADAIDPKSVPALLKDHALAAWASQTGQGLLFFSEKSADKSAPHGAIPLAEAAEPVSEGSNKFHFTAKGHKHTFKAPTAAERDNWVAQLKTKITEAKELATTVTESETYKTTLASFKPAPPAPKKSEEAPAPAPATEAAAVAPVEETPKEPEAPVEAAKEEPKKEEEPKRRSASRKRGSIFGNLLGKKEEKKEAEAPVAETPAEGEAPVDAAPAAEETPKEPEVPAAPVEAEAAAPATEEAPKVEEAKPVEKPAPSKRNSIFGNLSFGKKKHEEPAPKAKEPEEPVAETAPVIPAPEPAGDLSAEVSSPATVPTETVEVPPATNGETKKEVKSDKRKSSLPAIFGKKAAAAPAEEGEASEPKPKSPSPFSKFRATIKGKAKAEKPAEKTEEKPAEATEEPEAKKEEPEVPAAPAAAPVEEESKPADTPLQSTPAVTAAA